LGGYGRPFSLVGMKDECGLAGNRQKIAKRRFCVLRCNLIVAIYPSRTENLPIYAQKSWLIGVQSVTVRTD